MIATVPEMTALMPEAVRARHREVDEGRRRAADWQEEAEADFAGCERALLAARASAQRARPAVWAWQRVMTKAWVAPTASPFWRRGHFWGFFLFVFYVCLFIYFRGKLNYYFVKDL